MRKYPSLHLNTEYSILESNITIDSIISYAVSNNLKELVITDHNTMFGVPEFIAKCNKNGIKPIIGLDLDVENFRLILIARNYEGYQEISRLSSIVMSRGKVSVSDIDYSNIFIIDHPRLGIVSKTGIGLEYPNFFSKGYASKSIFIEESNKILENESLEILDFIRNDNKKINQNAVYKYIEDNGKIDNDQAIEIIKNSNIIFPEKESPLPKLNHGKFSSNDILISIVKKNIYKLLGKANINIYQKRLEQELRIIFENNFSDYFYIIYDLISWSKNNNVLIGPGRGSVGSSLVAYLLDITEIDPIENELLFERFINPSRINLPDIDIDIQDTKRNKVINYLFEKYEKGKVSYISTIAKLGPKGALRDVGRFLKMNVREIDDIVKSMNDAKSLEEALKNNSFFAANIEKNEKNSQLFKIAKSIESLPRSYGTHAAGIVISDSVISSKVPVMINQENKIQTQYSMNYLENYGLLKVDLLGLRNLSLLKSMTNLIKNRFKKSIDFSKLSLNNKKTLEVFKKANTNGIFQFESYGMKNTLKEINVTSFKDIVAAIALYRPGPMENIGEYAKRKKENQIPKIHPDYDEIVLPTEGIIIYQEQIMQIAQKFAGMSYGEADILRRAISKKDTKIMSNFKNKFLSNAAAKGHSEDISLKIYLNIEKFANYGFNKSHAVAYALLSYRMAFIKANFPIEFYSVILDNSSFKESTKFFGEIIAQGIEVELPNVNISTNKYENHSNRLLMPLNSITSITLSLVNTILEARSNFKFKDFYDAINRLMIFGISEDQLISLIEADSFRDYGNSESLLNVLPSAIRFIKLMGSTYEEFSEIRPKIEIIDLDPKIAAARELKSFGFLIKEFPTKKYENKRKLSHLKAGEVFEFPVCIERFREQIDSKGQKYGVYTVFDSSKKINLFVFHEDYKFLKSTKMNTIVLASIRAKIYNGNLTYNLSRKWKVLDE